MTLEPETLSYLKTISAEALDLSFTIIFNYYQFNFTRTILAKEQELALNFKQQPSKFNEIEQYIFDGFKKYGCLTSLSLNDIFQEAQNLVNLLKTETKLEPLNFTQKYKAPFTIKSVNKVPRIVTFTPPFFELLKNSNQNAYSLIIHMAKQKAPHLNYLQSEELMKDFNHNAGVNSLFKFEPFLISSLKVMSEDTSYLNWQKMLAIANRFYEMSSHKPEPVIVTKQKMKI